MFNSFHQRGFTLIEAMIGIALSTVIVLGVSQLFTANSRSYDLLIGQSQLQESGRFALSKLVRSARMAGYKGCFSRNDDFYKTFIDDIPYEFNLSVGLIGYEGETTSWSPDIETTLPKTVSGVDTNVYIADSEGAGTGIDTSSILRGTDIFTVNYIAERKHRLTANMPTSSENVLVDLTGFNLSKDYMAYIHDCEKGTLFRLTGFDAVTGIEHDNTVDPDGYTNAVTELAEFNSYETDAYVSSIVSHTYFVAPGEDTNNVGNMPMSLWRKSGISAPEELLEGIEDLQVAYGIDTDNDDIPNRYVDADSVIDFRDVLSMRISVVANSIDDVEGTNPPTHGCLASGGRQFCLAGKDHDGLIRREFIQTISLRN